MQDDRRHLVERGAELWHTWRQTDEVEALRGCLDVSRRAMGSGEPNEYLLQNLIRVLVQYHRATGDVPALDEALDGVVELIAEDSDPRAFTLMKEVLALGIGRPRHAEARAKFVTVYADLSLKTGEMLVGMAVERRDPRKLQEGIDLLDEALEAPTEDPIVRSKRVHARAWAAGVRWQMLRDPVDLDDAIAGFLTALSLAHEDVPAELHRNLALSYLHRYRRDGDFGDLGAAIAVLNDNLDREHQALLQGIYFERYEATADLADLDAAIELSRGLINGGPVTGLSEDDLKTNLRNALAVRQVYREDADVAAEIERLSDEPGVSELPYALTKILKWTRTWEDGETAELEPTVAARRVLFLRTFKDPTADVAVMRHLAAALGAGDRIVLLSDARDEVQLIEAGGERVELVTTTDSDWPRVVHEEMATADAVVLHLSPKDLALPQVSRTPDLSADFPRELWEVRPEEAGIVHRRKLMAALSVFTKKRLDAFDATPLGGIPTGAGLLRELAYLDRMGCLERTVVVLDNRHLYQFSQRVTNAMMSVADAMTVDGSYRNPRLTALERQLGLLYDHPRGITFSAPEDGCSPAFTSALAAALEDLPSRPATTADLPLGTSPHPRPLPPDGERKIISHTPVEDLIAIPPGQVVEIPPADILRYFTPRVVERGCTRCGGPFENIFFYTSGLKRPPLRRLAKVATHGKCQTCGRRNTVDGRDALADI
jgi:hypothetical protein